MVQSNASPCLAQDTTQLKLTRTQSARRAVAQNLQLIVDAIAPKRAQSQLEASRLPFAPTLQTTPAYRVATPFDTHDSHLDYATSVTWANPMGTVFGATLGGAAGLSEQGDRLCFAERLG